MQPHLDSDQMDRLGRPWGCTKIVKEMKKKIHIKQFCFNSVTVMLILFLFLSGIFSILFAANVIYNLATIRRQLDSLTTLCVVTFSADFYETLSSKYKPTETRLGWFKHQFSISINTARWILCPKALLLTESIYISILFIINMRMMLHYSSHDLRFNSIWRIESNT